MSVAAADHLLIHLSGELSIKGRRTRRAFVDRLVGNLASAFAEEDVDAEIDRRWSRLLVRPTGGVDRAAEVAARVFGIQAVARAERRPWSTLDDLLNDGLSIFAPRVASKTFAVRVRRGDQATRIAFKSPDAERRLGTLLSPHASGVDLEAPEVEARIELEGDDALYVFDRQAAAAGLPVGTGGRALALISGGFDSAVAAWLMLRRGLRLDYLFFNLGGDAHRDGVLRVATALADRWSYGYRPRAHVVDFRPVVRDLERNAPGPLAQVLLKRRMLMVASALGQASRAEALITGDAIAQVSSQTLHNVTVIDRVSELPVLRPLVGALKTEIMDRARAIGTYDLSKQVAEYCGLEKRVETHAHATDVLAAEQLLDDQRLSRLIDERAILDLKALDLDQALESDLGVDSIDPGSRVIDLRSPGTFATWHYPGAESLSYPGALAEVEQQPRDRAVVFYCEIGLKSAHVAEAWSAAGIPARHFAGGFRRLVRFAESRFDPALQVAMSPVLRD